MIEKNEQKERTLYTGISPVQVLAINPSPEELQKILELEETPKETEYVKDCVVNYKENGEDKEVNVTQLNLFVWVKESKTGMIKPIIFTLKDFDRYNKLGTSKNYVNQFGKSCFVDMELNLKDSFCTKTITDMSDKSLKTDYPIEYRVGKSGEAEFYEFVRKLTNINEFKMSNNMLIKDFKKLFQGNVSELREMLSSFMEDKVVACFEVQVKDGEDGDVKSYQRINNKFFLGTKDLAKFRNFASRNFEGLDVVPQKGEKDKNYDLRQFVKGVKDPEYGITKNYFVLQELNTYDPSANPIATNDAVVNSQDANY